MASNYAYHKGLSSEDKSVSRRMKKYIEDSRKYQEMNLNTTDRVQEPGESVPDGTFGPMHGRDIRGI